MFFQKSFLDAIPSLAPTPAIAVYSKPEAVYYRIQPPCNYIRYSSNEIDSR